MNTPHLCIHKMAGKKTLSGNSIALPCFGGIQRQQGKRQFVYKVHQSTTDPITIMLYGSE